MRFRFHAWQLVVLLGVASAATVAGLHWFATRTAATPSELISYLPTTDATLVYIDVNAIRRSGILNLLAGSKAAEEIEYKQFVDATQFDYRQDLDALGAAFKNDQTFFVLRGRFHWKNLMEYAKQQGGACNHGYCVLTGSRSTRRISFYALKPDVLALAVSSDDSAARQISPNFAKFDGAAPNEPVWALVPVAALANPAVKDSDAMPASAKPYVSALRNTERVLFALGGEKDHLELSLDASCRDAQAASALLLNLQNATSELRAWMSREHKTPDPADLTAILMAGNFHREDRRVYGRWPVPRAFVDAMAEGSF